MSPGRQDTILPIAYEEIREESDYWLMEKGGKKGAVDLYGQKIITPSYDFLSKTPDNQLVVSKNEKYGLIDWDEKTIFPCQYDSLYSDYPGLIIYKQNGKFGVMDNNQNTIISPQFDGITHAIYTAPYTEANRQLPHSNYFKVKNNGRWGLYHLKKGLIIPCEYYTIEPNWKQENDSTEFIHAIVTMDATGKREQMRGVVNYKGQLTVPPKGDYPHMLYPKYDRFTGERDLYAYQHEPEGWVLYNVNTGMKSDYFDHIVRINGMPVGKKGEQLGVFDELLKICWINRTKYPLDSVHIRSWKPNLRQHYISSNHHYVNGLHPTGGIVPINHFEQPFKKNDNYYEPYIGLLNVKTEAIIKPKYTYIQAINSGKETYYWAFEGEYNAYDFFEKADIYDTEFKKVNTIKEVTDLGWPTHELDLEVVPFQQTSESYGLVNYKGEIIYPAEYDHIGRIRNTHHRINNTSYLNGEIYYVLEKEDEKWLVDSKGKMVFNESYDNIHLWENYLITSKGGFINLYTNQLDLIDIEIEKFFKGQNIDSNYTTAEISGEENYFIKNQQFYALRNNKAILMNNEVLNFETHLKIIRLNYTDFLIDEKGTIVQYKYRHKLKKVDGGYTLLITKDHGYHLNEQGEITDTLRPEKPANAFSGYTPTQKTSKRAKQAPVGYFFANGFGNLLWKMHKAQSYGDYAEWILYDTSLVPVSSEIFDYPITFDHPTQIFERKGKFGVINDRYRTLVPPEYDFVYNTRYNYVLEKEGKWGIYSSHNDSILAPQYDAISTKQYPNGFIVFQNNRVDVLNQSFELIIPISSIDSIITHCDLANTLWTLPTYYFQAKKAVNYEGNIYHPQAKEAYRKLNNERIIQEARSSATDTTAMVINNCRSGILKRETYNINRNYCRNHSSERISHSPTFYNRYYYSGYYLSQYFRWDIEKNRSAYACENSLRGNGSKTVYETFMLRDNSFYPVTITDLLKPGTEQKLNDLLTKAANKTQALGTDCTDIDFFLEHYKQNFLLLKNEIAFYPQSLNPEYKVITLSYNELKPLLKYPDRFEYDQ